MTEMNGNPEKKDESGRSEDLSWTCSKCGTVNTGKFCTGCGAPRNESAQEKTESSNTFNASYTEVKSEQTSPASGKGDHKNMKNTKQHRSHPVLTVLLAAVIGAGAGFGGGYYAVKYYGSGSSATAAESTPTEAAETAKAKTETTASAAVASSSSSDSSSGEMTIQEIAAKASPSVVEIRTEITQTSYGLFGGTYTSEAAGSGVIISSDGYIITNNHVVEDANDITVTTYDGTEYEATLVGTDEKSDIAVIKVDATDLTAAEIGDSSTIQVGDTAVVIGNPLGTLGGTVTNGIISATDREITINNQAMNLIQTNAAINNGNSGGGLFNGEGQLIGIVNAKDSGLTSSGATIEGLGFAIPINEAIDVANQLIENGYVTDRATIGVTLQTITQDYGSQYPAGLYIASVESGSGAEAAGLQPYDRITAADGTEVSSYAELSRVLQNKKVGDTLTLTIVRDGKTMDVDVTLTSALPSNTNRG